MSAKQRDMPVKQSTYLATALAIRSLQTLAALPATHDILKLEIGAIVAGAVDLEEGVDGRVAEGAVSWNSVRGTREWAPRGCWAAGNARSRGARIANPRWKQ